MAGFSTWGSSPWLEPDEFFFWGSGPIYGVSPPKLVSAVTLSCSKIRVTYDSEVNHVDATNSNDSLHPDNYAFTGPTLVSPQWITVFQASPTIVDINVGMPAGMVLGVGNYTLVVSNVRSVAGIVIDPLFDTDAFDGIYCPGGGGAGGGGGVGGGPGPGGGGVGGADSGSDSEIEYPAWKKGSFQKILPSGVLTTVEAAEDLLTPLNDALKTVSDALGLISTVLTSIEFASITTVFEDLIAAARSVIFGTGFYYLDMWEHGLRQIQREVAEVKTTVRNIEEVGLIPAMGMLKVGQRVKFEEFVGSMITTMNDEGDLERPNFINGKVYAFVMVVGAPDIAGFKGLFHAVYQLFPSLKEIKDILDMMNAAVEIDTFVPRSVPPDWQSYTSGNVIDEFFPEVAILINDVFDAIIKILETEKNLAAGLNKLVLLVQAKVDRLNYLVQQLAIIISSITSLLSATGLYTLYVDVTGGMEVLKQAITKASNPPFDGLTVYVSGAMFLVGGESYTTFPTIFRELGSP